MRDRLNQQLGHLDRYETLRFVLLVGSVVLALLVLTGMSLT